MEIKNNSDGISMSKTEGQPKFEVLISNLPPTFKTQKLKSKIKNLFERNELFKLSVLKVQNKFGSVGEEPLESFALLTAPRIYTKQSRQWKCLFSKKNVRFDVFETFSKGDLYINRIFLATGNFNQRSAFNLFSTFGQIQNIFFLDDNFVADYNRSKKKFLVSFRKEVNFEKMSMSLVENPQIEQLSRLKYKDTKINRMMEIKDAEMKAEEEASQGGNESSRLHSSGQDLGLHFEKQKKRRVPVHNLQLIPGSRLGNLQSEGQGDADFVLQEELRMFDCAFTKKCILALEAYISENHYEGNIQVRRGSGKGRKRRRRRRRKKIPRRFGSQKGRI